MDKGDCHDPHGVKDMCVAGAIQNFTNQLSHYKHGTSDRRCKKETDLLLLLFSLIHIRFKTKIMLRVVES